MKYAIRFCARTEFAANTVNTLSLYHKTVSHGILLCKMLYVMPPVSFLQMHLSSNQSFPLFLLKINAFPIREVMGKGEERVCKRYERGIRRIRYTTDNQASFEVLF